MVRQYYKHFNNYQKMKAIILLGTLKKEGLSNTEVLAEFLAGILQKRRIECTIIIDNKITLLTLE